LKWKCRQLMRGVGSMVPDKYSSFPPSATTGCVDVEKYGPHVWSDVRSSMPRMRVKNLFMYVVTEIIFSPGKQVHV
jgi:hypothetical protein